MRKDSKNKLIKFLLIAAVAAAILLALLMLLKPEETQEIQETTQTIQIQDQTDEPENPVQTLSDAIRIDKIEKYTGIYVEDGSDEGAAGLLMMIVTNITEDPIQYAMIQLDLGNKTAEFAVSALPAGRSAMLIEQNRMKYSEEIDYYAAKAECTNLAGFDKEITRCEDQLEIQLMEGGLNIHNISGNDITGDIVVCYKNIVNGLYHGGIAYRIRLEGGLKAGEVRQIMAKHVQNPGSEVIFVEIAE